ncbi:hypothetical protein PVAG01_11112 [Phlyctema vagabunda]|uniref:Pentatricopeptide repeat-containing protein n=1 Tax=Phlyctema vagabunda TaxID=108571 RepID=A0ABR4P1N6_9HELO
MRTAELYRTATEIYLRRSVMLTTSRSLEVQKLVNAALGMIESLGVCTSPWPFFVAACEVIDDDQRFRVLRALHKMRVERRIGNIEIMREIIEGLWKKRDLGFSNLDWRQIAESQGHMPSFI